MSQSVEAGRDMFKALSRACNGYFTAEISEGFAEELSREHRTLQQNIMRVVIDGFIRPMAEKLEAKDFDMRNETAVRLAAAMIKTIDETNHALPYV